MSKENFILNNIIRVMKEQKLTQKDIVKQIGISESSFSDWKKGKSNSYLKHLPKIAETLGVTPEYLCEENITATLSTEICKKTYKCEIVNSLRVKENVISENKLNEIANYIGCNIAYLYGMQNDSQVADFGREINAAEMNVKLLAILMSLSATESYRILQIQISRKIMSHIQNWEIPITEDIMKTEIGINPKRVDFLCSDKSPNMRNEYEVGLNISDLERINEMYGISYTYMFTGKK